MRQFPIPYSITEEERIFGGYLSLRQVAHLAFSMVTAVLLLFTAKLLPLSLRLFFGLLVIGAGVSLSFIKIGDTGLDRYLLFAVQYLIRQKRFCLYQRGN
jgi:glucan phosphoethanolaminetransferase (alkaline phosphatase superfamily)